MASMVRPMIARGLNGTASTLLFGAAKANSTEGENNTATLLLINDLVFAESKSVRTSTIILAVFNILASAATAASILYDCYWASKRCNPKFKASKFCVSKIHPAETFPLILAVGIVVQGITFAVVQAQGLSSLFTRGCSTIAQFMWPAIMIVPYIQLVFGLECTLRSLRKIPFQARGKYDVAICCGTIILMLVATWIPSHVFLEVDVCFASLVWFISSYGTAGLIILSIVIGFLFLSAATIFSRLSNVTMIDEHQRIAASRMVYYLVLGMASLAFVIPYFVSQTIASGGVKVAMMATVVLNLSGLTSGLLHLFLRSNTTATSFGPKVGKHWNRDKHQIKIWGPNELVFGSHLADPISGPRTPERELNSPTNSRASLVAFEKNRPISMASLVSPPFRSPNGFNPLASNPNLVEQKARMPATPGATAHSPSSRDHTRKQTYSLFPIETVTPTKVLQNTRPAESVYYISDFAPPPTISVPGGSRHQRNSSISSSATVQIGLRLSHAPTLSKGNVPTMPLLPTTYGATLLPLSTFKVASFKAPSLIPSSTPIPNPTQAASPLTLDTDIVNLKPPARSPYRPALSNTDFESPTQSLVSASINKLLPPTPKPLAAVTRESNTQLSPAVYSPERKILGPKTVTTPQSASTPTMREGLATRLLQTSSGRTPPETQSKSDWI